MSKFKDQIFKIIENEPRVRIVEEDPIITDIFIQGLEVNEAWACYDNNADEIRINGEVRLKFDYEDVWINSDYTYDCSIKIRSVKKFKKYLNMALGLSAIFEQAIKQIKNLQKLDRIEDDF